MTADFIYNTTLYGSSLEGFLRYGNDSVNGWFSNLFLLFVFIVTMTVLSKTEWKTSATISFSFLFTFILALILNLIFGVTEYVMTLLIIGSIVCAGYLAISAFSKN